MKIVMLGHSGVGKTTYMASMYSALQNPIDGFGLRADSELTDRSLLRLHKKIQRGEYPKPSDQRASYDFVLTYEDEDFFPFEWTDYRGAALNEHRSSSQTREVIADLSDADGILVFVDSFSLSQRRGASNQIGRMTNLLGQTIADADRRLPLAIVLTKADLVAELTSDMLTPLGGIGQAIASSPNVIGTVIPVACGEEPANVHLPLLFTLHTGILSQFQNMSAVIDSHLERKASFEAKSGILDEIVSFVFSEPTYSELAQREVNEAASLYQKLQELLVPAQALESHLEGLEVF